MFVFGSKEKPQLQPLTPAQEEAFRIAKLRLLTDSLSQQGPSIAEYDEAIPGTPEWDNMGKFYQDAHTRAKTLEQEIQEREEKWTEQNGPIPGGHFRFFAPDIRRHAEQTREVGVEPQPWLLSQLQQSKGRRRHS